MPGRRDEPMLAVRGSQNQTDPAGRKSARTQRTCKTEEVIGVKEGGEKIQGKGTVCVQVQRLERGNGV